MKLDQLTPDQMQLLTEKRDEWMAIGLSTEPADRDKAEDGVRRAYGAAGLPAPQFYIWVNNPFEGALAQGMMRSESSPAQVREQVREQVGDQVRDQVRSQVEEQVRAQVRSQVEDLVWVQVGDQVRSQVRAQVEAQAGEQVEEIKDWYSYCWGQHDYWLSYYDTFDALGVEGAQNIRGLADVSRHAGWWWSLSGAAVLTERPNLLKRDRQGQLHCADGPAMTYPGGGFDMYYWHGTSIPAWVVENPTVEQALAEKNTEIRRCAIESVGWDKLENQLTLISEEPDPGNTPHTIRLYDGDILKNLYDEPARILLVHNASLDKGGARRRFGLPVPAHHTNAIAAAADLFGVPVAAYQGLVRAT